MLHCIYQEFYKLSHRKITYIAPFLVPLLMIIFKVVLISEDARLLAMANYNAAPAILLVLVVVGSSIFSMEYQNKAILTILYKTPSKLNVYLAKFIVVFVYAVIWHVLAIVVTALFQLTPYALDINWFATYQYGRTLLTNMIQLNLISLVTSLLIISFIFVTSCLINKNAIVVTTNIVIIFMGQDFSTSLLRERVALSHILKWNPLNMLALTEQFYNYEMYHENTMLNNPQIVSGTLSYIALFSLLGYLIFRKKRY